MRCKKNAAFNRGVGTIVVVEAGALVLTGTLFAMNPTSSWNPIETVVVVAPFALVLGTMTGLWKHYTCKG